MGLPPTTPAKTGTTVSTAGTSTAIIPKATPMVSKTTRRTIHSLDQEKDKDVTPQDQQVIKEWERANRTLVSYIQSEAFTTPTEEKEEAYPLFIYVCISGIWTKVMCNTGASLNATSGPYFRSLGKPMNSHFGGHPIHAANRTPMLAEGLSNLQL